MGYRLAVVTFVALVAVMPLVACFLPAERAGGDCGHGNTQLMQCCSGTQDDDAAVFTKGGREGALQQALFTPAIFSRVLPLLPPPIERDGFLAGTSHSPPYHPDTSSLILRI